MSSIVIVTNILKVAIASYSEERVVANIFDWFLHPGAYTYKEMASKGLFYVSIVSIVLVLLLPYVFYLFVDTKKKRYIGIGIVQSVALFMFGTKATSYGVIIVMVLMCALIFLVVL